MKFAKIKKKLVGGSYILKLENLFSVIVTVLFSHLCQIYDVKKSKDSMLKKIDFPCWFWKFYFLATKCTQTSQVWNIDFFQKIFAELFFSLR